MDVSPALPSKERYRTLDIVRGFALLGILVINMRYFSMPLREIQNPAFPTGEMAWPNFWTWLTTSLLFEDKMISLFSLMFGAGIFLMAERGLLYHYRRMFWLLVIGSFHAFVIWFGDILITYSLCGMLVAPLRRFAPGLLVVLGLVAVLYADGQRAGPVLYRELVPEADTASEAEPGDPQTWRQRRSQELRRLFGRESEVRTESTFFEHFGWRAELNLWWHFVGAISGDLWRYGGLMLIGMGLMGMGFFSGRWSANVYLALGGGLLLIGLTLVMLGLQPQIGRILERNAELGAIAQRRIGVVGGVLRNLGAAITAVGVAGTLLWACKARVVQSLLTPLAAVGRTALTSYITHSIVCQTIFCPWALGRWGTYDFVAQIKLVGAILLIQLVATTIWLRFFRFGPMEWTWRSLAWWKRQPFRC